MRLSNTGPVSYLAPLENLFPIIDLDYLGVIYLILELLSVLRCLSYDGIKWLSLKNSAASALSWNDDQTKKKTPKNILVVSNFVQELFCGELNLPMMSECAELSLHLSVMRGLWQYDRI